MFQGHPLFSLENVHRAYLRCRRRKRGTRNALKFEADLEANLVRLHEELSAGTYRPGPSVVFMVQKPKRREIFAADFRDRVVHHILVGHLEPGWERRFIHDSYACRKGRGTHAAVARAQSFLRRATQNGTQRAWYLQLDVRGFFTTLSRDVLYARVAKHERDRAVLWLTRRILEKDPTEACRFRRGCKRHDFEGLPQHKTLFRAEPGCGLPIGNLTSQFFANVYLDALDQFVKHELRAAFYLRYCDDFVLISDDVAELQRWEVRIAAFLENSLRLKLNQRRKLRPVSDGIDFLGYVIRPSYLLIRKRVVAAFKEKLLTTEMKLFALGMRRGVGGDVPVYVWPRAVIDELHAWVLSYSGHMRMGACHRLVAAVRERFFWLDEYFRWEGCRAIPRRFACSRALWLCEQRVFFERLLPGHVLLVQTGAFWRIWCGAAHSGLVSAGVGNARRFHTSELGVTFRRLRALGVVIGQISETGRVVGLLAERALVCRWPGAGNRPSIRESCNKMRVANE